jgi:hypothetical protein
MEAVMNLNNLIFGFERPACLRRRLVFGDVEQIEALKRLELAAEREIRKQQDLDEGILFEYEVTIQFSGEQTITVLAKTEWEAREIATDDPGEPDDLDADVVSVRVVEH